MFIVDAQVHIWGANTPERPWPAGRSSPHRPQPFSKDDLLQEMNAAEVARVVIVPPSWEGIATTWRWRRRASIPSARRPPQAARSLTDWRDQPVCSGSG